MKHRCSIDLTDHPKGDGWELPLSRSLVLDLDQEELHFLVGFDYAPRTGEQVSHAPLVFPLLIIDYTD